MRAVFGLVLVMLGLAMAVVWMPERDGQRQLAVVTDIAVQGLPRVTEHFTGSGRTFSPQTPLLATVEPPSSRPQHTAAFARVPSPVAELPVQSATGPSLVTGSVNQVALSAASAASRQHTAQEMPREELVRNLQRELKRVGCYAGDIDGEWGSGSKRAMLAFTDRVNASLPIDQPDFILLTLLKGQSAGACGKTCPDGQTVGASGRCLPAAVVAQQTRRRGRDDANVTPAAQPAPSTGWSTQVARAPGIQTRDQIETASIATAAASAAVVAAAVAPIPGRMSMGGPQAPAPTAIPGDNATARDAVRSAQADIPDVRASKRERTSRRNARRDRPVVVFRSAPNYYAYAPRRGRGWTATFFSGGF